MEIIWDWGMGKQELLGIEFWRFVAQQSEYA